MIKKIANINPVQNQLEERVKLFLKYQPKIPKKPKYLKRLQNYENYTTLMDPLNIKNEIKSPTINSRNNNNYNYNINLTKDKSNESSLSTQT